MKKNIFSAAFAVTAVAAVSMMSISCGGPKGMVAAVSVEPDTLNPVFQQNTTAMNINELLFDGLTNSEVDSVTGTLHTDFALAASIEQQDDKKTYVVELMDAVWHDGNHLTADDVVFSYSAYLEPANESPDREYMNSFINKVEKVDEMTVKIEFKNPIPEFRAIPVLSVVKIIPSKYNGQPMSLDLRADENTQKFATAPIGTGPYKLASWELGKQLNFEANTSYFKAVNAETLTVKRVTDPVVRLQELRKGRVNLILETNPADRPKIEKISDVSISSFMPYAFYQVSINTTKFENPEARQAMAMALDKAALIPGITDSESGIAINNGPFPSNLFATTAASYYVKDPMPNNLPYDLETAKSLAEKSGLANTTAILLYRDSMGDFGQQLADSIAAQLKEIGLDVDVRRTAEKVYDRIVYKEHSFELALQYCDGFDNVYSSIGKMYRSNGDENVTGISDKKLDGLFDAWEAEVETDKWVDLTLQLDKRITELCPALYICTLQKDVYSKGLENVKIASDNAFLSAEDWKFKN